MGVPAIPSKQNNLITADLTMLAQSYLSSVFRIFNWAADVLGSEAMASNARSWLRSLALVTVIGIMSGGAWGQTPGYRSTVITNDFATNDLTVIGGATSIASGAGFDNFVTNPPRTLPFSIPVPFQNPASGTATVNQVAICTNGWIAYSGVPSAFFTAPLSSPLNNTQGTSTSQSYYFLPNESSVQPHATINACYCDLDPQPGGGAVLVASLTSPTRYVVQFQNVSHKNPAFGRAQFVVLIFPTGDFEIHYGPNQSISSNVVTGVGIDDSTGRNFGIPSPLGPTPVLGPSMAFSFKRSVEPTVHVSQGGMTLDLGYSELGGGKFPATIQYSGTNLGPGQISVTATPPFQVAAGPGGVFQSSMNVPQGLVYEIASTSLFVRAVGTALGPVNGTITFTALGSGGNSVTINVKANIISPVANDNALTAAALQLNQPAFGYTIGANNDYQLPPSSTAFTGYSQTPDVAAGRDVVYSFIPPATGNYSIRAHYFTRPDGNFAFNPFSNTVIYAVDSLPGSSMSVTAFAASNRNAPNLNLVSGGVNWFNNDNMGEELVNLALTANQQIFIVVDDANPPVFTSGLFFYIEVTECVMEPVAGNDTPATATPYVFEIEGAQNPPASPADKDFYSLGTFPPGSRLFAAFDGSAGVGGYGLTPWGCDTTARVTTATTTLEYDADDAAGALGERASVFAGTIMPPGPSGLGEPVYLQFERNGVLGAGDEPYRVYAVVQPPIGAATPETEPNDSITQANRAINEYYLGAILSAADVDTYAISANAGDVLFIGLDLDPSRTNLPFSGALELLDSFGNVITKVDDPNFSSQATTATVSLTKTVANSPGEAIVFRVVTTGTYHARVSYSAGVLNRQYLLSVSRNGIAGATAALPSILTTAPTNVGVNTRYSYRFVAAGQPAPVLTASGLPGWLSFDGNTLSGTPTAADLGITGSITLSATNTVGQVDEIFQITVNGNAPVFTNTPVTTGSVNQLYSYTIAATGIPAPGFNVSGNPAWLTLSGSVLSGTPSAADVGVTGLITITASNGALPNAIQQFSIIVDGVAPTITSVAATTATAGVLYSYTIFTTGTPAPALSVVNKPSWLTLTGNVLSGTPGAANIGVNGPITLKANNGVSPEATEVFSITVNGVPPVIIGAAPSSSIVGTLYSYTISATGIPAPSCSVSGNPAWLTLSGNLLSGTPTVADIGTTGNITVTASNGIGQDQQIFQISVSGQPPQIVSTAPTAATVGLLYSYTVAANGQPTPTLSTNALPSWLSFNAATGILSGTPSAANLGLSSQIDITASNSWLPNAVQSFQIQVNGVSPVITSSALLAATTGTLYIYSIAATGNPPPTFSVSGAPAWLSLTGNTLTGTPSAANIGVTAQITVTATNTQGTDQQSFQILVSGVAPKITSAVPTTATAGTVYNYIIATTGTPAPVLSISGKPAWLTLTGNVLSGTPAAADIGITAAITLTAANGTAPDDTQIFQITVSGIAPTFSSAPVTAAASGAAYLYTATVAGIPTATLSVVGVLPSWLTFDPATATLSGTPSVADAGSSVPITLRAANGIAPDATQSFVITVTTLGGGGGKGDEETGGCTADRHDSPLMAAGLLVLGLAMCLRRRRTAER